MKDKKKKNIATYVCWECKFLRAAVEDVYRLTVGNPKSRQRQYYSFKAFNIWL